MILAEHILMLFNMVLMVIVLGCAATAIATLLFGMLSGRK
jgi:hypothetical protein